jgi:RNA polymerase sigma factor (sigma-70 family)
MQENYSDEEIVAMIQQGGKSCELASDFLYRKYKPIIYSFARKHGAKEEDMVDIFAETLSSCILNIIKGKFSLDRPLGVYMSVIYTRKTIKYCFHQEKSVKNVISSLQNSEDSDILKVIDLNNMEDPYDSIMQEELRSKMQEVLAFLQEKCRLLFHYTFQNMAMREIGELFIAKGFIQAASEPENAAKSQHKRCKNDLKQLIISKYPELVDYYLS